MARRFKTLDDVRRYASDVINRLEAGTLDETQAKSRMYCVNVLSGVLKDGTLEDRLVAIEQAVKEKRP